jgi:hypothetical protein
LVTSDDRAHFALVFQSDAGHKYVLVVVFVLREKVKRF